MVGLRELISSLRELLDHFYLLIDNGCLAVVVGNMHSSSYIIGYIKYCRVEETTQWCRGFECYERIVKNYDVDEVHGSTHWKTYVPCYDQVIPVIPISRIIHVYDPRDRVVELLNRVNDRLEYLALNMVLEIVHGTNARGLGITGSLLPRIHSVEYSDIDFIVYGWRDSINVIEFIDENPSIFKGFEGNRFREWVSRVAKATGLSMNDIRYYYRRWRRGLFRGREYSLIYNDGLPRILDNCIPWITLGSIEFKASIDGRIDALNYPSIGCIHEWEFIRGVQPRSDIEYLLSFEALYTPLFYEGGRCIARGLLQYSPIDDRYRVVVGIRETINYVKPILWS